MVACLPARLTGLIVGRLPLVSPEVSCLRSEYVDLSVHVLDLIVYVFLDF